MGKKSVNEMPGSIQGKYHYTNAKSWEKKLKVVFVEVQREDTVGVVFSAGGNVNVFPESVMY